MSTHYYIFLIIAFILVLTVATSLNSRKKLRKRIKQQWGTLPHETRFDQEEKLRNAYEKLMSRIETDSYIDDITWHDLDLFQVFTQINHTYSSIGSEALYRRLRTFNFNNEDQLKMEELIAYYEQHPETREEIEYAFARLGKNDYNNVVHYLTKTQKTTRPYLSIYIILGLLPVLGLILLLTGISQFGLLLFLAAIVFNLIYSQIKKMRIESELISMSYLVQTIATAKKLSKLNHPLNGRLKLLLHPLQRVLKFSFAFQAKSNSEAEIILDYLNMVFMIPFISYHFVLNRIKKYEEEAILLWKALGDIEAAYAILNYRTALSLHCQPIFHSNDYVTADKVYHPLVEDPVVNPVHWKRDTLVSGSNASGKSTYVKSVAINCILAQTVYTCLAESFSLQYGHVLTSMAVEDDVLMGDSYFVAEIKSLKRILDKVKTKERCYCFIDEILKGTNTIERIAASSSIIKWLNDYPSLTFVATHDIELTEMLKDICDNVHFREEVTSENGIAFDYKLQIGPATTRNALQLLQIMEYPEKVVTHAKENASYFEKTQSWT